MLFTWKNEGSKFGAVLDMITDRCSTLMLVIVLSDFYDRKYMYPFFKNNTKPLINYNNNKLKFDKK